MIGRLPAFDIAFGADPVTGETFGRPRGFIAIGDVPIGVFALGYVALGLFSIGGISIG